MSPAATPYPRRWKALVVLAASLLIVALDNTILNVALPTIREDLDADAGQLQWIVDSYLLVFAGLLLLAGTLGDRFGRRRMLFGGLVLFGAGSLWAAFSGSANELIAARGFMGIGAAAIMPTTLSILTNVFPEDERPKAIAIWASVAGLGVALGPTTGGWLIEHFAWNSVFLVNLPVVAAALIAGPLLIPDSRDPEQPKLDLVGAGLSVAGLGSVVWALIEAPARGWTHPTILAAFAVGAAIAGVFLAWERRCSHPMVDLSVFQNRRFTAANISVTFVFFALMGVMFFLTTYLQSVMGYSPFEAGIRMGPVALGMIVASRMSVGLVERLGTKVMVAGGQATIACALSLFLLADTDSGYAVVGIALGLLGTGMGLVMSPATEAIMGSLPRAKAGMGSAMNDVVRELGATLGVAVLGSILSAGYGSRMDGAVTSLPPEPAEAASDSVGAAHTVAAQLGGDAGGTLTGLADQAFVNAMHTTAVVAAAAALIGSVIAMRFLPARAEKSAATVRDDALAPAAA